MARHFMDDHSVTWTQVGWYIEDLYLECHQKAELCSSHLHGDCMSGQ